MAKKGYWIRIREEYTDSLRESFYDYFIQSSPDLSSATKFAHVFCQQMYDDADFIDLESQFYTFGDDEIRIELVEIKPMSKEEYIQMIMRQDTLDYFDMFKYNDNVEAMKKVLDEIDTEYQTKEFDTQEEMTKYLLSLTQDELDSVKYEHKGGKYIVSWVK